MVHELHVSSMPPKYYCVRTLSTPSRNLERPAREGEVQNHGNSGLEKRRVRTGICCPCSNRGDGMTISPECLQHVRPCSNKFHCFNGNGHSTWTGKSSTFGCWRCVGSASRSFRQIRVSNMSGPENTGDAQIKFFEPETVAAPHKRRASWSLLLLVNSSNLQLKCTMFESVQQVVMNSVRWRLVGASLSSVSKMRFSGS